LDDKHVVRSRPIARRIAAVVTAASGQTAAEIEGEWVGPREKISVPQLVANAFRHLSVSKKRAGSLSRPIELKRVFTTR